MSRDVIDSSEKNLMYPKLVIISHPDPLMRCLLPVILESPGLKLLVRSEDDAVI